MGSSNNVTNSQQSSSSALWSNIKGNLKNIDRTGLNFVKHSAKRCKELLNGDSYNKPSLAAKIIMSPIALGISAIFGAADTITEDIVPSAKQVYYNTSALISGRETVVLEDGIYYKNGDHILESLDGTTIKVIK